MRQKRKTFTQQKEQKTEVEQIKSEISCVYCHDAIDSSENGEVFV